MEPEPSWVLHLSVKSGLKVVDALDDWCHPQPTSSNTTLELEQHETRQQVSSACYQLVTQHLPTTTLTAADLCSAVLC